MRVFLALVVLLFSLGIPPRMPTGTSLSLEVRFSIKERQLDDLYALYWKTQYDIDRGDSKLSTVDLQKRIQEIETDPKFLNDLRSARFSDAVLRRRQELFLREAAVTTIKSNTALANLVEGVTRDESAMVYQVGGKTIARSALNNLLGHEPNRELRRQAWLAEEQLTAKTGERIRKSMKMRLTLAQQAGESFPDLMLRYKGIRSKQQVLDWFDQIQRQTEPEYQHLLIRVRKELDIATVEPWDLDYYFSTMTSAFEQTRFVPEHALNQIKQLAAVLGYDFDKLPISITMAEITFGGGTYPIRYGKDVRILVNKYEGVRFVDTLFHECGHGLHYSFVFEPDGSGSGRPSFILDSSQAEPFDEGLGQVMSLMIYRPQFAKQIFGLTPQEIASLNEYYRMKSLYDVRSTIADSLFEFAAYDNPDQDLSALYDRMSEKYLSVPMHAAHIWAYDPFYSSGPIYLQSYVLAEMVGRQVQRALTEKFGDHLGKEAGDWLRRKFFMRGGRLTLDEIMQAGTGKPLTDSYLINALLGQQVIVERETSH